MCEPSQSQDALPGKEPLCLLGYNPNLMLTQMQRLPSIASSGKAARVLR